MVQTNRILNTGSVGAKPKILVIAGATAVGKSGISVSLGERYGAEIIGADAMQIYRGFNIGTGKITPDEMRDVPHHIIDIVDPGDGYSVGRYVNDAREIIDRLHAANKPIIVTGGTGLYINALINGYNLADAAADETVRSRCQELASKEGSGALHALLTVRDPVSAQKISPNDTKRLIRALEIIELTGEPKSARAGETQEREFDAFMIVLTCDRAQLYERINRRVDRMIADGLEAEARSLLPYRNCQSMQAIGYKEFTDYFDGQADFAAAVELIKKRSRNYAKRQTTYFRWMKVDKVFIDAEDFNAVYNAASCFLNR